MKISPLAIAIGLIATTAHASVFETDYSISLNNLYGYTDYSKPYNKIYKQNNVNSSLNLFGRTSYKFNHDYKASLIGYFMIDSAKEIENYNQGIWGEEVYALMEAPWGDFSIGQDSNVAYKLAVGAPDSSSFHVNNTELVNFITNPNWYKKGHKVSYKTLNSTYINTDGASLKANYITPDFKGMKLGITYIPETYSQSGLVSKKAEYKDKSAYVLGGYGSWKILDYEIETSLGYADYNKNDKEYSVGMSIYHKGWTVGGSFRKTNQEGHKYAVNKANLYDAYREGRAYNMGISYEFGPITSGISYFDSKSDISANRDKIITFSNSFQYNRYMTLSLTMAHLKSKGENNNTNDNSKGYAVILGLELEL